jgi:hypothetical protein
MTCLAAHVTSCTIGITANKIIRGYCPRHYILCAEGKLPGFKLLPRRGSLKRTTEHPLELRGIDKRGYAWIRLKPDGIQVPEHRYVMEQTLGRELRKGESVHHLNGRRDDNHPNNLELWVVAPRSGIRASQARCPHCHKLWQPSTVALGE